MKQAKYWIKKAENTNPYDKNIQQQKEDISNLFIAMKLEKKQLKQQRKDAKKQNK